MRLWILLPPTLALLLSSAPVLARGAATPPVFSVHDLDGDGYLSRAEYAALRAQCAERRGVRCAAALLDFDALDVNRDGMIDEEELLRVIGRRHRGREGPHGSRP